MSVRMPKICSPDFRNQVALQSFPQKVIEMKIILCNEKPGVTPNL